MNAEDGVEVELRPQRPTSKWNFFGSVVPRSELIFFSQIITIYGVVVTSLVNLSYMREPTNLWIGLLGTCLGFVLPSPSIKKNE